MGNEDPLKDKLILAVDDEPDILESIVEELDMCLVHTAQNYETAIQYLMGYTYDIVILDIMGVNGFELLKDSVLRGFPTVMLTAYAFTPEALKKSMELGALFFLPKEQLFELKDFLDQVVLNEGQPLWIKFFDKIENYFTRWVGKHGQEKEALLKQIEAYIHQEKF
jgi:DNA-binding NtrC family response regulator